MKDSDIENAIRTIDEDYVICFKMIRKVFEYLETFGLKDFNRYSKYKWSYDRDRSKGYSYVCIRYGSSLSKKCLVKRRAYIEDADLYKWVAHKDLIQEALDEAYEYIYTKVSAVKNKMEGLKYFVNDYEEKLDDLTKGIDERKLARIEVREDAEPKTPDGRQTDR
ncbi:MAG: hypothetical protein LBI06_02965 [Treponema sp.]|jgi:hypothetical protein|nr:hypothetical protein [Treponema sp.]